MTNEILWFAALFINFAFILFFYRFLGKTGLFIWIPISVILANIEVLKTVEIFGFTNTLGNIIYATSFLVTDILSENHSKKEASKAVFAGFLSLAAMTILMNIAIRFIPAESDFASGHLSAIFSVMPRIALASLAAFLLSEYHDIWAYSFWKKKYSEKKYIWIRNNASTMVSQLIDSAVFTLIAFAGVFDTKTLVEIFLTTYIMKWIVAVFDTPCVYIAESWYRKGKILA